MKKASLLLSFFCGVLVTLATVSFSKGTSEGYIVESEKDIARQEPGSHNGGGLTTAYSFFSKLTDLQLVFRKRVLRPGSSIGYHLQKEDEIYYILQGEGEMSMNGKTFPVKAGDAVLTRPGNSHGLKPAGKDSLTVLINYLK
ncbi:MAG TPA: cupin domain-containing protein [Flavisolibacter sp.]|jgi:mannose-6-phosphate isomerase-like protein (cupin superfamily)